MTETIHIAIDGNEANVSNRVGSNVYAYQLLHALSCIQKIDIIYHILLRNQALADMPAETEHWKYVVVGPRPYWTQWALPLFLHAHRHEFSAFFTPGHYAPRLCAIPYISSVMDTSYISFPAEFTWKDRLQLRLWTKYSVKNAQKVLTISQESKRNVKQYYHLPTETIFVAYPGGSTSNPAPKNITKSWLKKNGITENYFIHVGTLQPRKRVQHIIAAFEALCTEVSNQVQQKSYRAGSQIPTIPHLVLAGKIGWLADGLLEKISTSPWKRYIHTTGFIPDSLKSGLIKSASALIAVGEGEGFGIPVLEALELKTPTIIAKTGSLPEVVVDCGYILPPRDIPAVTKAMHAVLLLSAQEKQEMVAKGYRQAKAFSWDASAQIVQEQLISLSVKSKHEKK